MKIYQNKISVVVLPALLGFVLSISALAQANNFVSKPAAANSVRSISAGLVSQTDQKLDSKLMGRQMPYKVLLPKNYASDGQARYPVIYLLHGLGGHYDNWTTKTKLSEYLAQYNFIVVTAEGGNGWYTDSATAPNDKYESYLKLELIPAIDKTYRTLADRDHRAIAGLSMGGYGSLKFGLKNSEMFALVGSFSGALGAAGWTNAQFAKMGMTGAIPESIAAVYGADDSQTRKDNDIFQMVKEITPEKVKTLPFIYQACGTEDFLIQDNHKFQELLNEKKIPHEFRESPGIHNWVFWEAQIQEFLRLSDRTLNKTNAVMTAR